MNNTTSVRLRVARFLGERYWQRERPGYFADFFLWGVIVITAVWPMFSLLHVMELLR